MSVAPNSPAERAGVRVGDVVTAIDANPIDDGDDLRTHLEQSGDRKLTIVVMRDGKRTTIRATPESGSLGILPGCSVHVIHVPDDAAG